MSEYVRLPPLPDSGDTLRSMTVIPYLEDMYHGVDDDEYDPRDPDEIDEHVIAVTEGTSLDSVIALVRGLQQFCGCLKSINFRRNKTVWQL